MLTLLSSLFLLILLATDWMCVLRSHPYPECVHLCGGNLVSIQMPAVAATGVHPIWRQLAATRKSQPSRGYGSADRSTSAGRLHTDLTANDIAREQVTSRSCGCVYHG